MNNFLPEGADGAKIKQEMWFYCNDFTSNWSQWYTRYWFS